MKWDLKCTVFKKTFKKLAADLNSDIQLEFVIDKKGTVKIVQLRVLKKAVSNFQIKKEILEDALVIGHNIQSTLRRQHTTRARRHSYSGDCSSEMLISKKTLIVETTLTFRIFCPVQSFKHSLQFTGQAKYSRRKTSFRFNTEYETGYIK
jgi:hypothetical protein